MAFSSTTAAVVALLTPASFSAASRSASEMNGTPLSSSTEALDERSAGTAGLPWMPVKNEAVSVEMRTAPASAVPIEMPRFDAVFWSPPTSPLSSSGSAETVTAPSCDESAPMPRPARIIGQVTTSAPAPASSAATNTTIPRNSPTNPSCETSRGEARGNSLGIPTAAITSVMDSGRIRTPVWMALSPSAIDRNSGTAKNSPACSRNWKKNDTNPVRSSRTRSIAGSSSAGCPVSRRCFSQTRNPNSTPPPARISHTTGDRPSQVGAPGLGCAKPHVPMRRTPYTIRPRPSAESPVPTRSRRAPSSLGVSAVRRLSRSTMAITNASQTNT